MLLALCFLIAITAKVGETYEDQAVVEGIGTIALPPGKWLFEHSKSFDKKSNNPDDIANAQILPRIHQVLTDAGVPIPVICTPEELLGNDSEIED